MAGRHGRAVGLVTESLPRPSLILFFVKLLEGVTEHPGPRALLTLCVTLGQPIHYLLSPRFGWSLSFFFS